MSNSIGRPKKFKNAKELQSKIDKYFKDCPDFKKFTTEEGVEIKVPCPTMSGLAYFLGFESRQSCYDYEKDEDFSYTIKRARLFIEREYEMMLRGGNCTGAIFALKNLGWLDKSLQEVSFSKPIIKDDI